MKRLLSISLAAAVLMLMPSMATAAGEGSITGTVTPIALVPEVEVCLVETRPSETCTTPSVSGTYTLTGLPTDVPIRIEFLPSYRSHYAIQYFDHADTVSEATPIILESTLPLKHVDADLEIGGAIEGTVAAVGGAALPEVEVCLLATSSRSSYGCAETGEAGNYRLGGLPPGTYTVGFWGRDGSAEYAPQYYDGVAGLTQAASIPVAAGSTVTGIDATMSKGAKVTGTVEDAETDATLEGIPVCLFDTAASKPSQCVDTGPHGSYDLVGLAPGSYQVGFSLSSAEIGGEVAISEDDGYLAQYYRGVATRSEAQILALSGQAVASGVDASLVLLPPKAPLASAPAPSSGLAPTPTLIAEPRKPASRRCKRRYVREKVKGVAKCVKRRSSKKRSKPSKDRHGARAT